MGKSKKKIKKQKAAAVDFTENLLPQTRRQQFFDCVKIRWSLLIHTGLIMFLFALPCFILLIYRDFTVMGFATQLSGGQITSEEYVQMSTSVNLVTDAINILCLAIASLGFAGAARIMRQLIFSEPVFFRNDFLTGIKVNGRSFCVVFVLIGLVSWINTLLGSFQFPVEFIKYIPYGIAVVFLLPLAMFILSQSTIYKNSVLTSVKNAAVLYIKSVPFTLLFVLVLALAWVTEYIPLVFVKYGVLLVYVIVLLPFYLLAWMLFSYNLFDRHINKDNFPEIYRKGLYTSET